VTDLGWPELLIVAVIAMMLFGSKKMPDVARSLGRSMRIVKAELKGLHDDDPAPAPVQQVTAQPAPAQPVTAQPVTAQPVTAQPVTAQPVTAEPVPVRPVVTEPSTPIPGDPPTR
jgi:sec-independent protein translocase protein TatA